MAAGEPTLGELVCGGQYHSLACVLSDRGLNEPRLLHVHCMGALRFPCNQSTEQHVCTKALKYYSALEAGYEWETEVDRHTRLIV